MKWDIDQCRCLLVEVSSILLGSLIFELNNQETTIDSNKRFSYSIDFLIKRSRI